MRELTANRDQLSWRQLFHEDPTSSWPLVNDVRKLSGMVHFLAYWLFVRGSSSLPVNGIQGKNAKGLVLGQLSQRLLPRGPSIRRAAAYFPTGSSRILSYVLDTSGGQSTDMDDVVRDVATLSEEATRAKLLLVGIHSQWPTGFCCLQKTSNAPLVSILGFRTTGCVSDSPVAKNISLTTF